jgi:hypothetical protein
MVDPIIPAPIMPIRMIRSDAATHPDGSPAKTKKNRHRGEVRLKPDTTDYKG